MTGPNKVVQCTTGTTSNDLTQPCTVSNKDVTDIYPIAIYDTTVRPGSNAANVIFSNK